MRQLLSTIILLGASLLSSTAFGATIEFRQDGWSISGPLSVSFAGVDGDLDGTLIAEELTDFQAVWRTPLGSQSIWEKSNIEPGGFLFTDAGNFLFFLRNSQYSLVDTAFEGEFLATVFDSNLFPVDSTTGPAQVVPEPGMFGLVGLSVVMLSRKRWRRANRFSNQQQ
jgi:hypothetical protein